MDTGFFFNFENQVCIPKTFTPFFIQKLTLKDFDLQMNITLKFGAEIQLFMAKDFPKIARIYNIKKVLIQFTKSNLSQRFIFIIRNI